MVPAMFATFRTSGFPAAVLALALVLLTGFGQVAHFWSHITAGDFEVAADVTAMPSLIATIAAMDAGPGDDDHAGHNHDAQGATATGFAVAVLTIAVPDLIPRAARTLHYAMPRNDPDWVGAGPAEMERPPRA